MNLEQLYIHICYIAENNSNEIMTEEPGPEWIKYTLRELTWVEYDNIQTKCMKFIRKSRDEWTINQERMQKEILKKSLQLIETSKNTIYDKNLMNYLSYDDANLLYQYYINNCLLTEADILGLDEQVKYYTDKDKINTIKPPYNRMIIILDLIRHFGTLTLDNILSLSKKDLDTLYILGRSGIGWTLNNSNSSSAMPMPTGKPGETLIKNISEEEEEILKYKRNLVLDNLDKIQNNEGKE
jgi:hypothetical protein